MLATLQLMVPSIATFVNEAERMRGATATWKDTNGFRTEHKVEFRYTKTSERMAFEKGEYVPGVGYVYIDKANVEHRLTQPRLEEILKQAIETNTLDSDMVARIKKDMEQQQANSTQTVEAEAEAVA